uniref:WWE domain-containing protein n=1 Tax=Stegastes partitus TaxID=144197 RepID=A0A3B5A392_9TELE
MLLASAVVVWEWLNEHGRWRPYSPAVCHHIEAVIRSDPRSGSLVLGQVDSRLSPYIIDLHSMHQFRQDTGSTCSSFFSVTLNSWSCVVHLWC